MATVSNFTALRSYIYSAGNESVFVQGYNLVSDGGQGIFFWNPNLSENDDDGTIIKVTSVTTGRWVRLFSGTVDVRWFGAVGKGSTDDTTSINNALTKFQTVQITNGIYNITGITMPSNTTLILNTNARLVQTVYNNTSKIGVVRMNENCSLIGGGIVDANASVTNPQRTTPYARVNYGIYITGNNCFIKDIIIQNTIFDCIYAQDSDNLVVNNIKGVNVGHGASFIRCNKLTISNYSLVNPYFAYTNSYPHCLDLFYCDNYNVTNVNLYNVNASSTAPSYAISGITLGGNSNGVLSGVTMNGFLTTVKNGLPIADDGSINCVISDVSIKGWLYGVGLEIQGCRNCLYDNIVIDGTRLNNLNSGSEGIHILDTAITGGLLTPSFTTAQVRDRSLSKDNTFSNIKIIGGFTGIRVAGSYNKFINCEVIGASYGFRLCQVQGGVSEGYWQSNIVEYIEGNEFINCAAKQCNYFGFAIFGGQENKIINPRLINNQTGIGNIRNLTLIASSVSANTIESTTTLVPNAWIGYYIYITNGNDLNDYQIIKSNTSTSFTIGSNWAITPNIGDEFVVVDNPQGAVYINGGLITDDQSFTFNGIGSMPNTYSSLDTISQLTITTLAEKFNFNQKIKLLNLVSGASSSDLVVQISSLNYGSTDVVNIRPLTLGDGSPISGTLSLPMVDGSGTITSSNYTGFTAVTSIITGTGTDFKNEIDAHYWILIDNTYYAQILQSLSSTQYLLTNQLPVDVTNVTFKIVKIDVQGIPSQMNGIAFNRYYGEVIIDGQTLISNSSSTNLNLFRSRSAIYIKLEQNSFAPNVTKSLFYSTNNSVLTNITNFSGGTIGKQIKIQVKDNYTVLKFTSSNLKGYNADYQCQVGDIIAAIYDGVNWYCNIITSAGSLLPSAEKFGRSVQSGNNVKLIFTINHGLSGVTAASYINVTPRSSAAKNISWVDLDLTSIFINYSTPPPSGTNNLLWDWEVKV
ncbi:hypothetical protein DYU05_18750 [Mucilaginibacter terrenus]|uniref:Pectate lyase superfamily protein domain-containing protein n=1 Tax=Mucilaginibacter terrenus TaxID=2482727 RepID=A0A3E2NLH6_9SPHI|nr:hypothetical protein [Mucilaginibacter terrenus]RFZ81857.1 hypothetical protein DYU05_18750 [Mucilaginibacter terrenus]